MKNCSEYYKNLFEIASEVRLEEINPQFINHCRSNYQRFIIQDKVEHIMKNWSAHEPYQNGLLANRNGTGEYWSINGQHHAEAGVRLGKMVKYYVFDSSGMEEEAEIFAKWQVLQAQGKIKPE